MGQLKVHPSEACREYEKYVYARVPKDIGQGSTSAAAPNSCRFVWRARCPAAGSRSPAKRERQLTMSKLDFQANPEISQKQCTAAVYNLYPCT